MVTLGQSFEVSFRVAPLRLHSNTRIPAYYLLLTTYCRVIRVLISVHLYLAREMCREVREETPSEMSSTGPWRRRRWRPISAPHCQPIVAS